MLQRAGRVVLALLLLAALTDSGKAEPEKFNYPLDKAKLLSGEIQVFEQSYQTEGKGIKKRVVGVMVLQAPPDQVWRVLENWDAMGPFVPDLEYNKTIHVFAPLGRPDQIGNSLIEGQIKVFYLSINYTLNVTFDRAHYRQEWTFVTDEQADNYRRKKIPVQNATSALKNIEGFEYIEPYGDGSSTIYYYAPIVETAIPVPEFVEKALARNTLNGYMEAIREMVKQSDKKKTK